MLIVRQYNERAAILTTNLHCEIDALSNESDAKTTHVPSIATDSSRCSNRMNLRGPSALDSYPRYVRRLYRRIPRIRCISRAWNWLPPRRRPT